VLRSFGPERAYFSSAGGFHAAAAGKGIEMRKGVQPIGDVDQAVQGGRDVGEKGRRDP